MPYPRNFRNRDHVNIGVSPITRMAALSYSGYQIVSCRGGQVITGRKLSRFKGARVKQNWGRKSCRAPRNGILLSLEPLFGVSVLSRTYGRQIRLRNATHDIFSCGEGHI